MKKSRSSNKPSVSASLRESKHEDGEPWLVPKLRFPQFRNAADWEEKTAGELFENRIERGEDGLPIYSVTIDDGMVKRSSLDRKVDDIAQSEGNKKACKNDIAYNMMRMWQGAFGVAGEDCMVSPSYVVLKPREGICADFFGKLLKTRTSLQALTSHSHGLTKDRLRLYFNDFAKIPLPLPSIPEQQKIADCLSSLDELIAAQGRKLDALKLHKKGLMQQLFPREGETQPRLRFPEFQNAGEWEVKPLGKMAENLDNRRVPITSSDRKAGNVPYYGASGVVDYVEGFIFNEDLLCVSEDDANLVARTYPIAFPISGKTWVNNHAHVLRFENAGTQKFVEVYLNSIKLDDFITGMAQPKLNRAMLDKIPIPHPEVAEQQRIASCLTSLDDLITAETQKLEALRTHKKALMQQLFPSGSETIEAGTEK